MNCHPNTAHATTSPMESATAPPSNNTLADILADPDTDWADIRDAIKSQGRGSFAIAGSNTKMMGLTTNAGLALVLRESMTKGGGGGLSSANQLERKRTSLTATSSDDEVEVNGDDNENDPFENGLKQLLESNELRCSKTSELRSSTQSDDTVPSSNTSHRKRHPRPQDSGPRNQIQIKGVQFTDPKQEQTKMDTASDSVEIDGRTNAEAQRHHLPARRLSRKSSTKGRGAFRGSLENVLEDVESGKHKDDSDDDESEETGVHVPPPRRLPAKGESYRGGSLENLFEDVEADLGLGNEPRLANTSIPARRVSGRGPSFRKNSLRSIHLYNSSSSISTCDDFNDSINMMDFGYSERGGFCESLASDLSPSTFEDSSSNLVDSSGFLGWGGAVDDTSSKGRLPAATGKAEKRRSSTSLSVDSDGFLGWKHSSRSLATSVGTASSTSTKEADESICLGSTVSSTSTKEANESVNLGWDNGSRGDSSRDLTASTPDTNGTVPSLCSNLLSDPKPDERDSKKYSTEHQLYESWYHDEEKGPVKLHESWRIEDFESGVYDNTTVADEAPSRNSSGSGNILNRLGSKVTEVSEGISSKLNTQNTNHDHSPKESIQTSKIKRILLKGHSLPEESLPNRNKARAKEGAHLRNSGIKSFFTGNKRSSDLTSDSTPDSHLRNSGIKSFFNGNRRSSDLTPDFEHDFSDTQRSIRINRDDGVDINELCRDLYITGNNNEQQESSGPKTGRFNLRWAGSI